MGALDIPADVQHEIDRLENKIQLTEERLAAQEETNRKLQEQVDEIDKRTGLMRRIGAHGPAKKQ